MLMPSDTCFFGAAEPVVIHLSRAWLVMRGGYLIFFNPLPTLGALWVRLGSICFLTGFPRFIFIVIITLYQLPAYHLWVVLNVFAIILSKVYLVFNCCWWGHEFSEEERFKRHIPLLNRNSEPWSFLEKFSHMHYVRFLIFLLAVVAFDTNAN